jgi:hypothetical protein
VKIFIEQMSLMLLGVSSRIRTVIESQKLMQHAAAPSQCFITAGQWRSGKDK